MKADVHKLRQQLRDERHRFDIALRDNLAIWTRLEAGLELAREQLRRDAKAGENNCTCRLCAAARIALALPPLAVQRKLRGI